MFYHLFHATQLIWIVFHCLIRTWPEFWKMFLTTAFWCGSDEKVCRKWLGPQNDVAGTPLLVIEEKNIKVVLLYLKILADIGKELWIKETIFLIVIQNIFSTNILRNWNGKYSKPNSHWFFYNFFYCCSFNNSSVWPEKKWKPLNSENIQRV